MGERCWTTAHIRTRASYWFSGMVFAMRREFIHSEIQSWACVPPKMFFSLKLFRYILISSILCIGKCPICIHPLTIQQTIQKHFVLQDSALKMKRNWCAISSGVTTSSSGQYKIWQKKFTSDLDWLLFNLSMWFVQNVQFHVF